MNKDFEERLILSAQEFREVVNELVESAKSRLHIEFYIFSPGQWAEGLIRAILKKATEQLKISIAIDAVGSPLFKSKFLKRLKQKNIFVRIYNPLDRYLRKLSRGQYSLFRVLQLFNRRNHRKLILIDGTTAIIGSFNIDDRHLQEIHGKDAWRDIAVCIQRPEVAFIDAATRALMTRQSFPWWQFKSQSVLLNQGTGSGMVLRRNIRKRLETADRRIWIQNPYFAPIRPIFDILVKKARAGVDVRIIVPHKNDIFFMKWISYYYFRKLMHEGIQVYEYLPTFSHQKILQVDDRAFIGSINFNHRSFLYDLEIEVEILKTENKQLLEKRFLEEQENSRLLELPHLDELTLWERLLSRLFLLIRYWC